MHLPPPRPPLRRPRLLVEELDPRILYSADAAALLGLTGGPTGAEVREFALAPPAAAAPVATVVQIQATREIVFVDSRVPDAMALADQLLRQRGSDRSLEVVVLDANEDGIAQIDRVLAGEHDLGAVHLISHGSAGAVQLGATVLDEAMLARQHDAIAKWGDALADGGDLLVYGCNVAGDAAGQLFLRDLGAATGADVAGSTGLTGSAAIGGDWTLEFATGAIHTQLTAQRFDALQWQGVLATFTVTNTNDNGAGSLRQAIQNANANGIGLDLINFNIAGTGIHTITLGSALSVQGAVTIDATSDDSFGANGNRPAIVLDGGGLVTDGIDLYTNSSGSTIRGLVIQNFTQDGIDIASSNGNTIVGNWIGVAADGVTAAGNQQGVNLWNSSNNIIGGASAAERNVISGNSGPGIDINTDNGTSTGNQIRGNYIGTTVDGLSALGNGNQGIFVNAQNNTIGGTTAGYGNVISGTLNWAGVTLQTNASGTLVAGNLIGLNANGDDTLANNGPGIDIYSGNNTIGGTTAAARNVIAGTRADSARVLISGNVASFNVVVGNYIGTDITGTRDLDGTAKVDGGSGVVMVGGASFNRIGTNADGVNDAAERNVISGNNWYGVEMIGVNTAWNVVQGNYIGTTASGLAALGNSNGGVSFWGGARDNALGSGLAGAGNVISGNETGVLIANAVTNNKVQGNLIGLGADGSTAVGNTGAGVYVYNGGSASAVSGNLVGTNADGSNDAGERNVISANANGVVFENAEVTGNTIAGNYIGTDATGLLARGNIGNGVVLIAGAHGNTVGGSLAAQRNVISGNLGTGVDIDGEASDGNTVRGNWIGVNANGTATLANATGIGVVNGADNTTIGGTGPNEGNWVAGNTLVGIEVLGASSATVIQGNRIGTDLAGTANWGQGQEGIWLQGGASGTLVGGTLSQAANVIAFNGQGGTFPAGISVQDASSTGNVFLGNSIYSNVGLGIDLALDGVTANDAGDADIGPNNLLNTIVLGSATITPGLLRVTGTYSGAPNTYYRVELFSTPGPEASGAGEGRTLLGTVNMPVGASGTLTGSYDFGVTVADGTYLSATVTRTDAGYGTFFETSEFSNQVIAQVAGITVTPSGALTTTEAGGTVQFGVVLDSPPSANVTIALSTSDATEGTLSTNSLTFTPANWNVAQLVTVTGVDDTLDDGDVAYGIVTAAAVSADAGYHGLNAADLALTNTDDDTVNTVTVDTAADTFDGNTTSLAALLANRGADGRISLREAITAANNTANGSGGADRIVFAISGTGEHVINLASLLPQLTQAVSIDASTDDSFAANGNRPAIVLDGNNLAGDGLVLTATADGSTVRGLVIRDFAGSGIVVQAGSDGNTIAGNAIGRLTSAGVDAGAAEANTGHGIVVAGTGNVIGGATAADRNVVAGNAGIGVFLSGNGNTVIGNHIGVDASGNTALGNGSYGIDVAPGVTGTVIGTAAAGNVVSGNLNAGVLFEVGSAGTVQGNRIGTNAAGNVSIAGNGAAVFLANSNTLVGGTAAGEGNTISGSSTAGVIVSNPSGAGIALLGNAIFGNAGLAIDLGGDGVTANDAGDADSGANHLQNFPVLTLAGTNGSSQFLVNGTLDSAAAGHYRVEFYANAVADASGHGEGQRYLGFVNVTTDGSGHASFSTMLNANVALGEAVSATATLADASFSAFTDTSEFATTLAAAALAPQDLVLIPGVSAANVIGHYGFSDASALGHDDAAGAPMTLSGSPLQTTGADGSGALALAGGASGQHGEIVGITTGGAMTFSASVRFDSTDSWQRVVDFGEASSGGVGSLYVARAGVSSDLTFTVEKNLGGGTVLTYRATAPGAIVNGQWLNFTATVDGTGQMALYLDGAPVATQAGIVLDVAVRTHNYVGFSNWAPDRPFQGAIDNLLILQGALDAAQVAALYQQTGGVSVPENSASGTVIGTVVSVDADATHVPTFTLTDDAGGRFAIDAVTGTLTVADGIRLDFEAAASHAITVRSTNDDGLWREEVYTVAITNANDAPVITSQGGGASATATVAETLRNVATVAATDQDGDALAYSVVGGTDAVRFQIDATTGALRFVTAPDFEAPGDANGDNVYQVVVQASDGRGGTDTQAFSITVTDVSANLVVTATADTDDTGLGVAYTAEQLNASRGTDGAVSLREALIAANTSAGADTITFGIGIGVQTIALAAALPTVTDSVTIDGWAQPGYAGTPLIVIDGEQLAGTGLRIGANADGSTVRGLVLRDFAGDAIVVDAGASGTTIAGNYIGAYAADGSDQGAAERNLANGIAVFGDHTTIGGTSAASRNVIGGNAGDGIRFTGGGATDNTVLNNLIGLNAAGTAAVGNGVDGVRTDAGAARNAIGVAGFGNVISGNAAAGLSLGADQASVQGNLIGTDITGTVAIANLGPGVRISGNDNTVGGAVAGARNVISGNADNGIFLSGVGLTGNVIAGNHIGTTAAGDAALGNGQDGVWVDTGVTGTTISGNLISGNANRGVYLKDGGNTVTGNTIGLDAAGTVALGNAVGVSIVSSGNTLGGTGVGAGNLIGGNLGAGVSIASATATGNTILGNRFRANGGLAIDLGGDGVTANDAGDADTGANHLLNTPVLMSARTSGSGQVLVTGTFDGAANANLRIEFVATTAPGASGHGGADRVIGFVDVTTDATGHADFSAVLSATVAVGETIGATATLADAGFATYTDTSEFALNTLAVVPNRAPAGSDATVAGIEDTVVTFTLAQFGFSDVDGDAFERLVVASLPSLGTLRANGVALTAGDSVLATDIALGRLTYTPPANANGSAVASFTFQVQDAGGTGLGGTALDATANTLTIDLAAVNDAPVGIAASLFPAIAEDSTGGSGQLVSAFTAGTGDADAGALKGIAIEAADATHGQWQYTLDGSTWLAVGAVSPAHALLLPADATTRVRFVPAPDWNGVAFPFSARAWDQTSGSAGSYADASVTGGTSAFGTAAMSVSTTVTPVDDAPVLGFLGTPVVVSENAGPVVLDAAATVADIDSADFAGGQLVVGFSANGQAEDRLAVRHDGNGVGQIGVAGSVVSYGSITIGSLAGGNDGSTPLVVTLNANADAAAVQALLRSVTYENVSNAPSNAVRTVQATLSDGDGATSAAVAGTLGVTALNDAPTVTATPGALAVTENDAPVAVDPGLVVADVDSATLAGATVRIAGGYAHGEDTLAFTNQGGITGNWNAATGTLTLTGNASVASYEAALRSVTCVNTSDAPSTALRTVEFSVDDGAASSAVALRQVQLTALDDAPTANPAAANGIEDDTSIAITLTGADVDDAIAAFRLVGLPAHGNLYLDAGLTTPAVAGTDLVASTQALTLYFVPAADWHGSTGFDFVARDAAGLASALPTTATITVAAVNDAPVLTASGTPVGYAENAAPVVVDAGVAVADVDGTPFAGGTLTVGVGASAAAGDRLVLVDQGGGAGQVSLAGQVVSVGGVAVGQWLGGSGGADLVVTFGASADAAAVQAVARAVGFDATSDDLSATPRTVRMVLTDGAGGTSQPSETTLTPQAIDDAPTIAAPASATVAEDGVLVFGGASAITVQDADAAGQPVQVTLAASHGTLALADTGGLVFGAGSGTGDASVTFSGVLADVQRALDGLAFRPDADFDGAASVQITIDDLGHSGAGGPLAATHTIAVTVTPVADAPTGAPAVVGSAVQGQALGVDTASVADADGLGPFAYQWLRDGQAIAGANAAGYLLTEADVGAQVAVRVGWTDGLGTAEQLTSAALGPVGNVDDAPSGVPVVVGAAVEDQTLGVDTSAIADADGLGPFTTQWLRDGAAIGGATAATYTLDDADVGHAIAVRVSYVDGHGTANTLTSAALGPVANVPDAPTGLPAVTGVATEDETLGVDTSTIADADGLGPFTLQWLRDGVAVAGATGSTYTLGDADVGARIAVRVAYVDGQGSAEGLTSAATAAVANIGDAPTGAPAIAGTAITGRTLTADTDTIADADGLGAYSYAWLRNGVAIGGANAASYTLAEADAGQSITVRVTWLDGHGTPETLTSAAVTARAPDAGPGADPTTPTTRDPGTPAVGEPRAPADVPAANPAKPASASAAGPAADAEASANLLGLDAPATPAVEPAPERAEAAAPEAPRNNATAAAAPRHDGNADYLDLQTRIAADDVDVGSLALQDLLLVDTGGGRSGFQTRTGNIGPAADGPAPEEPTLALTWTQTAAASGMALTAGTVWWALRTGGLLTSLMVSMPAWRHADLLAVLPDDEEDDPWDVGDDAEARRDEEAVGNIFDTAGDGVAPP